MTEKFFYLKLQSTLWQFQTITVSECSFIKLLKYILFEKYINILALEMGSPGSRHCASCIGTLSFLMIGFRIDSPAVGVTSTGQYVLLSQVLTTCFSYWTHVLIFSSHCFRTCYIMFAIYTDYIIFACI